MYLHHSGLCQMQAPRPSVPFGGGPPTPGGAAPAVASAPRPNANGPGFGGGLGGGFGAAQRPQQPARPTSPGSQALAQRPLGGGGLQRPLGGGLGGELQRPPMQPPAAGPGSSSMSQQRAQQQQLSQQQQPTASGPRSASGGGSIQAGGMQGLSAALPGSSSRLPSQAGPPQPPMLGRTGPPAPPLAAQPGMGGQHAHGFPPGPGGGMQPPRHMQPPNGMPHPSGPLPPPGMRPPGGSRPPSFGRPPPQFGQPQRTQQQQPQRGPPGLLPSTPPFPGATAGVSPLVISPSAQSAASPSKPQLARVAACACKAVSSTNACALQQACRLWRLVIEGSTQSMPSASCVKTASFAVAGNVSAAQLLTVHTGLTSLTSI